MSILGINYEKCNDCNICLKTCFLFRRDKVQEKIVFNDPMEFCNLCGKCIAKCPQNAILYEGIGEAIEYEGVNKPETIVDYDTIYKFLRANRSVRLYKEERVSADKLKKIVDVMSYAPTGDNVRSEQFSVISDRKKMKNLNDAVIETLLSIPEMNERYGTLFGLISRAFHSPIYFDAPHVIFVESSNDSEIEANNIGIIITYGRLAAQALGLGTCWNGWTQIAMRINPKIKEIANIKGKRMGAFIVGYSAEKFYRCPPRSSKSIYGLDE